MKKSLFLSLVIHAGILMIVAWSMRMVPEPEKTVEPMTITIMRSDSAESKPPHEPEPPVQPVKPASHLPLPAAVPQRQPHPLQHPKRDPLPATKAVSVAVPPQPSVAKNLPPAALPAAEPLTPAIPKPVSPKPAEPVKKTVDPAIKAAYLSYVRQTIDGKKNYPKNAKRLRQTGIVTVRFTLRQDGSVAHLTIAEGTGFELLDRAALELFETIERFRPFPDGLEENSLELTLPIEYALR